MKSLEAKSWLHKLFNSSYFDSWMIVSYLYRYPQPGIHYYLCDKLFYKRDIYDIIPELVHIFFYHPTISLPLYNFLINISKRSKKYALAIYFQMNIYKNITEEQRMHKEEIINQILNANIWDKRLSKIRTFNKNNLDEYKEDKEDKEVDDKGKDNINNNNNINNNSIINNNIKDNTIINNNNNITNQSSNSIINNNIKDNNNNSIINNNIKDNNNNINNIKDNNNNINNIKDNNNNINNNNITNQSSNSIINNQSSNSIINNNINNINFKTFLEDKKKTKEFYSYLNHPIPNISCIENKTMSIESVFLYFISSVSMIYNPLCKNLKNYEDSLCRINKMNESTNDISFINELILISDRLRLLPKKIRERALQIELKILNTLLPKHISLPIAYNHSEVLLKINIKECKTLDSAVNAPYILVYEVCKDTNIIEIKNKEKIIKSKKLIKNKKKIKNLEIKINKILEKEKSDNINDNNINDINDNNNIDNTYINNINNTYIDNINNINNNIDNNIDNTYINNCNTTLNKKINNIEDEELLNEIILLNQLYTLHERNNEKKSIKDRIIEELLITSDVLEEEKTESRFSSMFSYFKKKKEEIVIKNINFNIDTERIESEYKKLRGWEVKSLIIKIGTDLRQELVAYHVLREMKKIWEEEGRKIWVEPYEIYLLDDRSALVEPVKDAQSIHFIKKYGVDNKKVLYLKSFFIHKYGDEKSPEYFNAVSNFLFSLAGYSLATYFLQLKDRHNGNILLKNTGQIVHIDFGFILGQHPGFYAVETAPFKFSNEYLDLLGDRILEFKILFYEGFISLRKYSERLCRIIEIMNTNNRFLTRNALEIFRDKFKLELSEKEVEDYVDTLINWSFKSMTTGLYDSYQYFSNGYLK